MLSVFYTRQTIIFFWTITRFTLGMAGTGSNIWIFSTLIPSVYRFTYFIFFVICPTSIYVTFFTGIGFSFRTLTIFCCLTSTLITSSRTLYTITIKIRELFWLTYTSMGIIVWVCWFTFYCIFTTCSTITRVGWIFTGCASLVTFTRLFIGRFRFKKSWSCMTIFTQVSTFRFFYSAFCTYDFFFSISLTCFTSNRTFYASCFWGCFFDISFFTRTITGIIHSCSVFSNYWLTS